MAVYVRPLSREEVDKIHDLIEMEKEGVIKKRFRIILLSHQSYEVREWSKGEGIELVFLPTYTMAKQDGALL